MCVTQTGGHTGQKEQDSPERGTVQLPAGAAGPLPRQGQHSGNLGKQIGTEVGGWEPGPLLHHHFGLVQAM